MRPLDDVRIVAVEQYGAGPWASLHLADLGAEVIKVEDPSTGGDVGRYVPPFASGQDSLFFQAFNRNKKSIALDLTNASGRGVFEDLVAASDAVFSNLRGDVPKRLGLVYDDLKHLNGAIVCCSLSAYGMTGPRSADPGYDYVLQGLTGWMSLTGEPDSPPTKTGLSLVDYSGGYVAAISLLAGIHSARRTGIGMDCDVSLFDTAISLLTYVGTWTLSDDDYNPIRTSHSAHPSIFPFQAFETADGWIMIACPKEKFWQRLLEGMELDMVASDERYAGFARRLEFREELTQILGDRFLQRGTREWVDLLHPLGVPCGPVNDVRAALDDPHVAERDLVIEYEQPGLGTVRTPRTAVNVGKVGPESRSGPALAENSEEILRDLLGYSDDRVESLNREGAFGTSE
ncbi:MAG: CoA transferase [Actinomycetota bacterium]|nr:CoA transferase [Actinomycetota bacterium]